MIWKYICLVIFAFAFYFGISFVWASNFSNENPIIIDSDMGEDDWIAILYLLRQPHVKINAITLTGDGLTHCNAGIRYVRGLLALAKQSQIPVGCGRVTPLRGYHVFPSRDRYNTDHITVKLPTSAQPVSKLTAVELLKTRLTYRDRKNIILVLGPLTNIAELLLKYPDNKSHIQAIYIMGGAIHVPGNIRALVPNSPNKIAEWNIYIDPYAADVVFRSGIPIVLVPLDATNQVPLDENFYSRLKTFRNKPMLNLVYQLLCSNGCNFPYFWDTLTAAVIVHRDFYTLKSYRLKVVQTDDAYAGATVLDPRGSTLQVVDHVNSHLFMERLFTELSH